MPTKPNKTVFWFDDGKRPNVADSLEKEKDIILHRLAFNGPKADNWGAMSASQVYCITSTRQELPERVPLQRGADRALSRSPRRVDERRGLRHGGRGGVHGGGRAGGEPVGRQRRRRGGAHGRDDACRSPRTSRRRTARARRCSASPRETFKGWNAKGRTVGLVGIGNVGSRVARICGKGLRDARARVRSLSHRGGGPGAGRDQGGSRNAARRVALRLDPLPAERRNPRHDRRPASSLPCSPAPT